MVRVDADVRNRCLAARPAVFDADMVCDTTMVMVMEENDDDDEGRKARKSRSEESDTSSHSHKIGSVTCISNRRFPFCALTRCNICNSAVRRWLQGPSL